MVVVVVMVVAAATAMAGEAVVAVMVAAAVMAVMAVMAAPDHSSPRHLFHFRPTNRAGTSIRGARFFVLCDRVTCRTIKKIRLPRRAKIA